MSRCRCHETVTPFCFTWRLVGNPIQGFMQDGHRQTVAPPAERAAWLRTLALAQPEELDALYHTLEALPQPADVRMLRAPHTGMAMVRARSGGTGEQFNLGEMTVTRCALALPEEVMGVAYVQGRNSRHAKQAALLDALLQLPHWHDVVRRKVLLPLEQARSARHAEQAEQAATTKVEFFTLERGSDE